MVTAVKDMDAQNDLFDVKRLPKTNAKLVHGTQVTGKANWYTPEEYIRSARRCMGGIDLDPASCQYANKTVGASVFYDENKNGLLLPWSGRVWLNPPYNAAAMTAFVEKLIGHLQSGQVKHAILLTHNNTDTRWAHLCMAHMDSVCHTRGRIRFYDERGQANSPTHGHTFYYFSGYKIRPRRKKFVQAFSSHGTVLERVK